MKNILIVVDMQKGFARYEQTKQLTERVIDLLEKNIFDAVIATRFLNDENSIYEKLFDWKHLESDDERTIPKQILEHVDYVADKYIYNCPHPECAKCTEKTYICTREIHNTRKQYNIELCTILHPETPAIIRIHILNISFAVGLMTIMLNMRLM